jgi:uncharacterized protein YkwD
LPPTLIRAFAVPLLAVALSACSMMGGGGGGLPPGLAARMDQPGANLDRAAAIGMINQYRASVGAPPLQEDASLDSEAAALVGRYALSGAVPELPGDASAVRVSAGYPTFAETFSGWRNSPADAAVLADRTASRAGVASTYSANSGYGVYWVLLLGR